MGLIVPVWKRKGDVHDPGKYRGITLLSNVLKVSESILDGRIRRIVECEVGEEQQGFRRGRGTADGMFTLRQLVEKKIEGQENKALGFIDLEKAYDTVPIDMTMATLRWMGVPEAEVRMVEGTHKETKGRVVCRPGISEEFRVDVGLRQGSALSPLLFIAVMEVISRKACTRDILRELVYTSALRGRGFWSKLGPACSPRAGPGLYIISRAGPGRAWAYILRARAGPGLKTI